MQGPAWAGLAYEGPAHVGIKVLREEVIHHSQSLHRWDLGPVRAAHTLVNIDAWPNDQLHGLSLFTGPQNWAQGLKVQLHIRKLEKIAGAERVAGDGRVEIVLTPERVSRRITAPLRATGLLIL